MTTSFHKADNEPWPTPLELYDLRDAVIANQDQVILSDKKFNIKYKDKMFFVSPVEGFVPCGWFEYNAFALIEKHDAR